MSNFQITQSVRVPRWVAATAAIVGGMTVCVLVLLLSGHTAGASDLSPPSVSVPSARAGVHATSTVSAPLPLIGESPAGTDPTWAPPAAVPAGLLTKAPSPGGAQLAGQVADAVTRGAAPTNLGGIPLIPRTPSPLAVGNPLPVAIVAPDLIAEPSPVGHRGAGGPVPSGSQLREKSSMTPQDGMGRVATRPGAAQHGAIGIAGRGRSPRRPTVPIAPIQLLVSLATSVGGPLHGGSLGSLPPATLVLAWVAAAVEAFERRRTPRMRVDPRLSPPG